MIQPNLARLDVAFHRDRARVRAGQLMQDAPPDDAGQGNAPIARLKVLCHAVLFLAAIGLVAVAVPVVEQDGQRIIVGRGNRLRRVVNLVAAIVVFRVPTQKEKLGKLPQRSVPFLNSRVDVVGRKPHLFRKLPGKGGKQHILSRGDNLLVLRFSLGKCVLVIHLHLRGWPEPLTCLIEGFE